MRHQARVVTDAVAASSVLVELDGVSACQRCAKGHGCGVGLLGAADTAIQLQCRTQEPLRAGQRVTIAHEGGDSSWLWLVMGAYGLPLIGVLVSAVTMSTLIEEGVSATDTLVNADTAVAFASLAGLLGGLYLWRRLQPLVLMRVQPRLCLQSVHVVDIERLSTHLVAGDH